MPNDKLTLTIRLHDEMEKTDKDKATSWVVAAVAREDLQIDEGLFIEKYLRPALRQLKQLQLTSL